jgi:hypothetical protein
MELSSSDIQKVIQSTTKEAYRQIYMSSKPERETSKHANNFSFRINVPEEPEESEIARRMLGCKV